MLMPVRASAAPSRFRGWLLALVLTAVTLLVPTFAGSPARAATRAKAGAARVRHVPAGFVGVDIDGPLFDPASPLNLGNQMTSMVSDGVQSVRVAFNWAAAQPYASSADVPADRQGEFVPGPDGRPITYSVTDQIVGNAAAHGLTVLPTLLYAPPWDARPNDGGLAIPDQNAPYAEFAAAMVQRYGPRGTFWTQNPQIPRLPVRMWQIWNEPNLPAYWPQPFAASYVGLLHAAHDAIKQADPRAKVVIGALTNFAWRAFAAVYRVPGGRKLFDVAAVNGFTATPADVILYWRFIRRAMARYGDGRKPLLATEVSWPSAQGQSPQRLDFSTTERGQAQKVAAILPLIASWRVRLRLIGFYYYTWIDQEHRGAPVFAFAGLQQLTDGGHVRAKPALRAFTTGALAIEGCRAKGDTALICKH
ncbi:MAG TPA: hypothetical protein VF781_08380 [Solirubrobacteraceae bacterium]